MNQTHETAVREPGPRHRGTDHAASIAADEFVWTDANHATGFDYVLPAVVKTLTKFGAHRVLDLGCGNGATTSDLVRHGFDVAACDMSSSGLSYARANNPGIQFFEHDFANELPEEHRGRYDAVVAIEVIEHLLLPRRLLTNALQALRPGGLLVLSTPYHGYWKNLALAVTNKFDDHWHPLRDFGHVKFFSRRTITGLLRESGFAVQSFQAVGRVPLLRCSMVVSATTRP